MKKYWFFLLLTSFCFTSHAETCLNSDQITQITNDSLANLECSLPTHGYEKKDQACLWQLIDDSPEVKEFLQKSKTTIFVGAQWSSDKGLTCQYKTDEGLLFNIKEKKSQASSYDFSHNWNCDKNTNSCECKNASFEACHFTPSDEHTSPNAFLSCFLRNIRS